MHIFLVIVLFALFASLFGLSKAALDYAEPFFLIGFRMFGAGLVLLLYQLVRAPGEFKKITPSAIKVICGLGFLGIYVNNIAEIWGLQHMISAKACLIYSLSPFLSALLSFFMFKETLPRNKWLGLAIGFVGLMPMFYENFASTQDPAGTSWAAVTLGECAVLVAVVASVYGWILLKQCISVHALSPITANACGMCLGGALALMHSYLAHESWDPWPVMQAQGFLQNTCLMAIISNFISYNLYGYLLKHYTATFMSFAGLITPLFASLFGWLFLQEKVSGFFFASFALFSIGLWFYHQEELRKGSVPAHPSMDLEQA
jgi:drug/metabolite transporter (DMT)-like permease